MNPLKQHHVHAPVRTDRCFGKANSTKAHAPTMRGAAVGFGESRHRDHTGTPPDVDVLLSRLDRVRQFGKGWSARCPAHQDRQASLSVTIGNDGRILAHCFAGCAIVDVLGAVGLTLADLFPARNRDDSPGGRRDLREVARQAQWRAALGVLAFEASVIAAAAFSVLRRDLSDADAHRVVVAAERIDAARAELAPAESFRPKVTA